MKLKIASFIVVISCSVVAQSSFQNLDFEQADPIFVSSPVYTNLVTAASALPYWSVYYSGVQQAQIFYNGISTGATAVDLESSASQYAPAIDGNYSVLIQGIVPGSTASISQTGLIPVGTQSLFFEASTTVPGAGQGPLELLLGTQPVPFAPVGTGPNYTLYGANVSAWAGNIEQLTFSALGGTYNNWELDDISFSPTVVPEPNTFVLTAIGGLLCALYRRYAAKRQ